ncbi:ANTAR domain-containing protein [Streptomyces sp. NPDC101152]|uniref:ANTAR domain-containing protein n=1 Tax=Streptomyces sp. NPDC101152 TaxID=3366116 RepID=UPI00382F55D1
MTSAAGVPLGGRLDTLVIDGRVAEGRAMLAPRGELVRGCADTVARTLDELPPRLSRIELDMAGVFFMDTAGLQFLDVLDAFGHRHRIPVRATRWNGQPRRILELVGLDTEDPLRAGAARSVGTRTSSAVARERAEQLDVLREEVEQLRQAMVSRPVIDQARGVLMAAHGCTSEQAWDVLREASQHSNTKLREVAAAVVATAGSQGTPLPATVRDALRTAISRRLQGSS